MRVIWSGAQSFAQWVEWGEVVVNKDFDAKWQRRRVETAQAVVAVTGGAEWTQKSVDHHRHDALRVLDCPHAAKHLTAIGQALWSECSCSASGGWSSNCAV